MSCDIFQPKRFGFYRNQGVLASAWTKWSKFKNCTIRHKRQNPSTFRKLVTVTYRESNSSFASLIDWCFECKSTDYLRTLHALHAS